MTNPVTPNIGLNKIDRTSPSTTYFDLEKYIDQNADAVDRFAGETSEAIGALEKRLDTEERREVVLQPGLQIVNAERSAPFKLSGIKGRTLVNLLGRDGGCESLTGWTARPSFASASLDTSYKESGTASIKITQTKEGQVYARTTPFGVRPNSNLVAISYIKNSLPNSYLYMRFTDGLNTIPGVKGNYVDFGNVGFAYRILTAVELGDRNSVMLDISNSGDIPVGSTYNIDSVRVYEISAAEYAALDGMTPEQVAAKYPYVDSIQPVRNPYAIRYGKNLLPPFYEWVLLSGETKVISPYELKLTPSGSGRSNYVDIPVKVNETYYFSGYRDARYKIEAINSNGAILQTLYNDVNNTNGELNTQVVIPEGTKFARIVALNDVNIGKDFTFKNPMLTLDTDAKSFKPREDSMLALQTDLYADPVTGANDDEVFEKAGQYFKLKKWNVFTISNNIQPTVGNAIGYKKINMQVNNAGIGGASRSGYATKYDGKVLAIDANASAPDTAYLNSNGVNLTVTVASTDSGWGDNYTPTADEIKAYFMGWKMYDATGNASSVYNGAGGKAWVNLAKYKKGDSSDWSVTLPTATAKGYTEYQLVYQLATPMIEAIVSEGMVTFNEGENQIEVGSGIVIRENNVASVASNGVATFNGATYPLKNRVAAFIGLYKDRIRITPDSSGFRTPGSALEISNGPAWASLNKERYDASAAYSVTYLTLDKSPVAPFTGSYAANEKLMLQELTDAVQQNVTSVSVLMNKKADRDTPGWITPTLINGWIPYAESTHYYGYTTAQYMKDSQGFVYLRGLIKKGSPSTIFYLPGGYRPKQSITFVTICYDGSTEQVTRIRISSDGSVSYVVGPAISAEASWLSLNLPPFTID